MQYLHINNGDILDFNDGTFTVESVCFNTARGTWDDGTSATLTACDIARHLRDTTGNTYKVIFD